MTPVAKATRWAAAPGDACTVGEACDGAGVCAGGEALLCQDDNPCTGDTCDPVTGCVRDAALGPCSDGDVCTVGDACAGGKCAAGEPQACNDGNSCTDDSCDPKAGCQHVQNDNLCCKARTHVCDDGKPCTIDLCDPVTPARSHEPYQDGCNDGDACTTGDVCAGGQCKGQPKACRLRASVVEVKKMRAAFLDKLTADR